MYACIPPTLLVGSKYDYFFIKKLLSFPFQDEVMSKLDYMLETHAK
jgi:hypothetical protein